MVQKTEKTGYIRNIKIKIDYFRRKRVDFLFLMWYNTVKRIGRCKE